MKFLKSLVKTAALGLVLALVFCLGIRVMDRTPVVIREEVQHTDYTEARIADLEALVESLTQEKAQLTAQVEQYRAQQNETCMLVLRHEELVLAGIFGDTIVVELGVQEIAVNRELYESCQVGDDITTLRLHRLLSCDGLSDTRVIVENKYILS